jgi:curved DNA-binding protein
MVTINDYYCILGVAPNADLLTIKQAYRRLARQYHPDVAGSHDAAERFKAIGEAYRVLSNPEQRRRYDARVRSAFMRGRDREAIIELTLAELLHGAERHLQIDGRTVLAQIPAGLRPNSQVRLRGLGDTTPGGAPGDLYLLIVARPDARFQYSGDDLTTEVTLDLFTAIVGGEVVVDTLDGPVLLKIPHRTQTGTAFRLRGMGLPRAVRANTRGDLYVRIQLNLPDNLTEQEVNLLRDLARARAASQRYERA